MSGLYYPQGSLETSLGFDRSPESVTQGAGLQNLGPSAADIYGLQQQVQSGIASLAPPPAPPPPTASTGGSGVFYSPSTGQMFAGGTAFDTRDVQSALLAASQPRLGAAATPPSNVPDWQPLSRTAFQEYISSLSRPRGTGELLVSGARGVAGGVVSGFGALAEMAGATEVGPAIMRAGETISGQDEFERQRSALIQRNNSAFSNILDAAIQGVPSLVASGIAGLGGAAIGGAVGGPAGAAAGGVTAATLARARTIGAIGGAFAVSFPQQVSTMYEAAQNARTPEGQPAYNTNDTSTQLTILGAAFGTSLLDAFAPGRAAGGLSTALARAAEEAGQQAVRGMARARAVGGAAARSSLEEAATEATQTLVERAVFDPEFRRQLNANDWKALAPYIVEKYGEDILISAGAGALLGGGFGGAGRFIETRPRDILTDAGAPPAAPPGAALPAPVGAQGELFVGQDLGVPPYPVSTPTVGGGILYPQAPTGQGELFPGAPPSRAPLAPGVQGDLFTPSAPAVPPGPVATQLTLPFAGAQGELFPGAPVAPAPPQVAVPPEAPIPEVSGVPAGQRDLFERGARLQPTMPAPQVFPTRPTLAPETFVTPGMERLRRPVPETAAPVTLGQTEVGNRLLALRRQMELQQAQAQAATQPRAMTAAERDYEAALAQQAMQQPLTLDAEAVVTGRNRPADNARRSIVQQFNALTKAQQDEVLVGYNNDPATFLARVQRMPTTGTQQLRNQLNRIAETAPVAPAVPAVAQELPPALAPLVAPTAPAAPAAQLKRGAASAAQVRQIEQGGVGQRADVGGRLAGQGQNRLQQAQKQAGGGQAGGRNRLVQGRAQAQTQVVPAAEAAPRPLEVAAAPVTAERVAPSAGPRVEADLTTNLNAQIDRATTPAARQRLKVSLINRRNEAADAGRSTTELTVAIARLDEMAAEPVVEGVMGPGEPQSVWASLMDDDGTGYLNMSEDGRRTWDIEVKTSAVRPTQERAQYYQDTFLSEDTQKGLSYVRSLAGKLEKANDEQYLRITEKLNELSASDNKLVAAEATRALDGALGGEATPGRFSLSDWNTTGNARNLNGTAATPMVSGRARIIVQNFLSKLATKPNVTVVANQEELRRTNPALYQRAVAARPQGDFATAQAAGYSFGDGNVVIFTDRIANEQHLRFVLAHETFGHFGMRGIMPAARFDALMENIYETDSSARLAVDAAMTERGLTKAEATEEYLSDYAALLETSTVARIWNAIKGFLDRLGIKSGDIATRYFLDQSRRYVRQGAQGVTFDAQAVMNRLHAVEYGDTGTGRFSPQAAMRESAKVNLFLTQLGGFPRSLAEAWNDIQAQGGNIANVYDIIKAKFLSLANYRALENAGLAAFDWLMGKTNQIAMSVKAALNEYMAPLLDAPKATQDKISRTMYDGRSYKISQFKASNMGKDPLFTIDDNGEFKPNEAEQDRVFKAGLLKLDEIRNGYSYDFSYLGTDGKMTTEKRTVAPQKDFSDADYKLYERARQAMFNVEMQLVQAEYASFLANKRLTSKEVSGLMKSDDLTADDRRFVDSMARHALALYTKNITTDDSGNTVIPPKSMEDSSKFLAAVNAAFIGERTDRNADVREFFDSDAAATTFVNNLMDFKSRRKELPEATKFVLQDKVKQLILNQHNLNTRDRIARRAMMTGYTPVLRQGSYQMRLQAFVGDKPVEVKDAHQSLLTYSQFDNESSAINMAKRFSSELQGKTFELLVRNDEGEFVPTKVTLRASTGVVLDAVAADPQLNLQEFLYGMNLFNINVNPTVMERLVTTLSRQEDSARQRLNYSQTPGFDPTSGIFAISRHIESRASTIAKASTRQALRELMNLDLAESRALWEGDAARVRALEAEMDRLNADPNASQDAKRYAQQQLSQAQYQYRMTNPNGDGSRSRANLYYNQAASTLDYLEGSKYVDESDFGAGPVASRVRAFTSVWQLGGSIAQGALNLLSPYTNWMPYMASFNAKNGFGGGFGIGKVQAAYHTAFMQVGSKGLANMAMNRADFYDAVAKDAKLQKQYGLTVDEAQAIATEIREGKLIPAQSNALIATARGQATSKWARNFIDTFMAPFNLSEQAARRSAFLAAYRLQRDRATAAGKSAKEAQQEATDFAVKSIDLTLGEYSVLNRPPAWRGGITSFIYMYKTYPTTTIQLLANLSRPAQLSMLAAIWALSGVAGLPFAEDFEDVFDTFAQVFGAPQGSIRAEMIRHIEKSFPGWSATFFKGVVSVHGGPDIASRTSLGNIVPGTGAFLAGADVSREFADILGPAAGFISGTAKTARDLVVFPFSASKSLEDVARESPVTLLRLMGDSYAYMQSGAVVDRRGYVVSKEMDMGTIFTRLAGFYPASAAAQYDVIRIANRETDYQKEAVAGFRHAWIKATLRGDTQGAAAITASVNEWNNATRGTTLEIRNFAQGNVRALREAQRPAGERTLRAAPRAAQEDIRGFIDALTE
jgi:hypothetical protein